LKYSDKPNYQLIRNTLQKLQNGEIIQKKIEEEKFISNFASLYQNLNSVSYPSQNFHFPLGNPLHYPSSADFELLYQLYHLEYQSQINNLTAIFVSQLNNLNCKSNSVLAKKRERSQEDEELQMTLTPRSTMSNSSSGKLNTGFPEILMSLLKGNIFDKI
jgi:hypothetical protein